MQGSNSIASRIALTHPLPIPLPLMPIWYDQQWGWQLAQPMLHETSNLPSFSLKFRAKLDLLHVTRAQAIPNNTNSIRSLCFAWASATTMSYWKSLVSPEVVFSLLCVGSAMQASRQHATTITLNLNARRRPPDSEKIIAASPSTTYQNKTTQSVRNSLSQHEQNGMSNMFFDCKRKSPRMSNMKTAHTPLVSPSVEYISIHFWTCFAYGFSSAF